MTHLLDSNTCIHVMRPKGSALVKFRYAAHPAGDVVLNTVVAGELFVGVERSTNPPAERARVDTLLAKHPVLVYDLPAAEAFGRIRAALAVAGTPIGPLDAQIAAIALVHGLTLVTHNTGEFSRVPGLRIEDWELP